MHEPIRNIMRVKNLFGIFLFFLPVISLVSCTKEEWDLEKEETEHSTVIEGTILTSGGMPLADINVKVDYSENKWLQYAKTRHKGETKTDKNGKYRLHFQIKDDEQETDKDKEFGVFKSYSLIYDLKNLNPKEYILPGDMIAIITSVDPPIAEPAEDIQPEIRYGCTFKRSNTYTNNLYIPRKRYIQVTLKGFVPQQQNDSFDYFKAYSSFPYGGESTEYIFPGTNYKKEEVSDYMFTLYSVEEKTFEIPFALNENNIITLLRKKDGVHSTETYQLFVTEDNPKSLTYEY